MTGDRPTRLNRRLLRALELRAADATWDEIARTPLTPQDPTQLYRTAAAAQDAVEDELVQLRTRLAKLRIPRLAVGTVSRTKIDIFRRLSALLRTCHELQERAHDPSGTSHHFS